MQQDVDNDCLCNFFPSDIQPIPQTPIYFLSTQSENADTFCEWIDYGCQEYTFNSVNNEIVNSHFYKRTLLTSKELNIQMSNAFTFSFQEHNKQNEELNNTNENENEYLLTINFNDNNSVEESNENDCDIINGFVDEMFKECKGNNNWYRKGEPCEVYSDLIIGSGSVDKRYEEVMNFKCKVLQNEIEVKNVMIEEMKKEIEKYKKENQDVMEENKKLFEVIDMLQQIKEKEIKHTILNYNNNNNHCSNNDFQLQQLYNNENENSLRSSNDSIPILIENKRTPFTNNNTNTNNNNFDKENIKSKTITAERQHSITSKTKNTFNKHFPTKNSKSSAVSPSNYSPGHLELNITPNELNKSKHIITKSKHSNSKEHMNSKRNTLTNVYSNSYLFNGTKCYITINQPSTKNSTHKQRITKPPIPSMPVYVNNKHCGNSKLNMKIMNSSPSQRKVQIHQQVKSKCLYKDEEKTNSLDDIEKRLSMYVSDAIASGCIINNNNQMNYPYDNSTNMYHQMNNNNKQCTLYDKRKLSYENIIHSKNNHY